MAPASDGRWHHYAAVWDGAEQWLYIDGRLTMRLPAKRLVLNAESITPVPARIGGQAKRLYQERRYFRGMVDEMIVLPRAMSGAEVGAVAR